MEVEARTSIWPRLAWRIAGAVVVGIVLGTMYKVKSDQTYLSSPVGKSWKWGTSNPALQEALESNDGSAVTRLLKSVSKREIRPTFLSILARDDRAECLEGAINAGWNPNGDMNDGAPIIMATRSGQVQAIRVFLKHGAKTEVRGPIRLGTADSGLPLMCIAAKHPTRSRDLVKVLLDFGVTTKCSYAYLSRSGELRFKDVSPVDYAPDVETVRLLLDHGAPLPKTLGYLIEDEPLNRATLLLDRGLHANRDPSGSPYLIRFAEPYSRGRGGFWSQRPNSTQLTRLLLEHGADANVLDRCSATAHLTDKSLVDLSATPLYLNALMGNVPSVKLLLAHGADPHKKASNGQTPLDVASGECKEVLLQAIRSK